LKHSLSAVPVITVLSLAIINPPARASVTGTVIDTYGGAVPDAVVTFTDEANDKNVFTATTDSSGVYTLEYLEIRPPYDIVISDVTDDQGHTLRLSWSLSPDDAVVTKYNIYRSGNGTLTEAVNIESFSSLEELVAAEETTILIGSVSAGVNSYLDTGVPLDGTTYYYWIEAVSGENTSAKAATGYPTAVEDDPNDARQAFKLRQNYPNPFNPSTTISFELYKAGYVELSVYNVLGRNVRTLIDRRCEPGMHSITWDGLDDGGGNVAAGIYLYRLHSSDRYETKRMLLIDGGSGNIVRGSGGAFQNNAETAVQGTGGQVRNDPAPAGKNAAKTYTVNITHDSIIPYEETGVSLEDGAVYDFTVTADYVIIEDDTTPTADAPETDDDVPANDLNSIIGGNSAAKRAFDVPNDVPDDTDVPGDTDIPDTPADSSDVSTDSIDTAGKLIALTGATSPCLANLGRTFESVPVADILALNLPTDEPTPLIEDAAALVINTAELASETIESITPPSDGAAKRASIEVDYKSRVCEGGYLPDDVVNSNPVQYRSYRIEPWKRTTWHPESGLNKFRNDIDFTVQLWGDFENTTKFVRIFTTDSGGFTVGDMYTTMEEKDKGYYQGATYVRIETIYDNSLGNERCDWLEEDMSSPGSREPAGPGVGIDYFGRSTTYFRDHLTSNGYPRFRYKSNTNTSAIRQFMRSVDYSPWDIEISEWSRNGKRISWRHGMAYAYHPDMDAVEPNHALRHPMLYTVPPQNHYLKARKITSWGKMVERRDWASDYILLPTDLAQGGWRPQVQVILKNAERPDATQRFRFKTTQYARRTYLTWGKLKHRVKKSVKWRTFVVDFSKVGPGG